MRKPRLLDLFCGAGGCSVGYSRAGFEVVGVDINPQPHYPFEFRQADATSFPLDGFDVIHASPPCQRYSAICKGMGITDDKPDLVDWTRVRLLTSGVPYVIENVVGSPLENPIRLCGSMFGLTTKGGLWLRRHRLFESNVPLPQPKCQHPRGLSIGVYGNGTNRWHRDLLGRNITTEEQREAMGIDWMPRKYLTQAIPPAYTEWIGKQIVSIKEPHPCRD
jgi:DNA (cytosine-5)-methyltransferase 1